MLQPLVWLGLFLTLLLILILITEWLHVKKKWPSEQSRKFLHVSGGLMCLLLPLCFSSHWWILGLASIAFIVLFTTYRKKLLASVHEVGRDTVGSVLFPFPVYCCFLCAELTGNLLYFFLPISLLTISDTAAEMGGQAWGKYGPRFFKGQKTLIGSLCFFSTAVLVCFGWMHFYAEIPLMLALIYSICIAIGTALAELVTLHGWDNLTVPAVALLILQLGPLI